MRIVRIFHEYFIRVWQPISEYSHYNEIVVINLVKSRTNSSRIETESNEQITSHVISYLRSTAIEIQQFD